MKHTIRQRGQFTQIDGELGSGLFDKNGREIFEGDKVEFYIAPDETRTDTVSFCNGGCFIRDLPLYLIEALDIEVVGHADD